MQLGKLEMFDKDLCGIENIIKLIKSGQFNVESDPNHMILNAADKAGLVLQLEWAVKEIRRLNQELKNLH